MPKYQFKPNAQISTATYGGEELRFAFDKSGHLEVPDDFQEATAFLDAHPDVKRVKAREPKEP